MSNEKFMSLVKYTTATDVHTFIQLMVHSHCTGPGLGMGTGPGPGMIGLYVMPLTVHNTQEQAQGIGPGTNGLHTHFSVPFLVPVLVPFPFLFPPSVNEP